MSLRARAVIGLVTLAWMTLGWGLASAQPPRVAPEADIQRGDYRIVQWTTAQGLPQNTVNDIVLLPNGELWVATFGGLARFDGHRFDVVDMATDEGLPANRIVSLAMTGADAFWFLTQQGHLGRVDRGRPRLLVAPPSPPVDTLGLLAARGGRLFCKSTDGGLWQTDGTQAWQRVTDGSRRDGVVQSVSETDDGGVWATWGGQLVQIAGGTPAAPVTLREPYVATFRRKHGGLWLGLGPRIARFLDGRIEHLDIQPPLQHRVTAIQSEGDGSLWVASRGDVSRLDREPNGSWVRTSLPLGLPEGLGLRSLLRDDEGRLWIGTEGLGLYRVNRPPTRRFGADLALRDTSALAPDGAGGAFAASGCRGLFHIEGTGRTTPVRLDDPADATGAVVGGCGIALASGPGADVWVRAGPRLFKVWRQRLEVRRVAVDLPDDEGPVVANPDGSVWVVSRKGTVQLVSSGGRVARELPLPPPLMSASLGPDTALWVGGDGQVFKVGRDAVERFGPDEHVPRGLVRDIVAEADGTTWIGTYGGGLGRLRDRRVVRLTVEHGLPDNSISRILDDRRGRMWISTNRGVAVVDRSALEAAADGRVRMLAPVVFGPERGVAEANFGSPAGFADADGRLWFGTIDGVAFVDATRFPFNTTPPNIRIEGIWADDRPLALGETVRIPPLTARVHLSFTAFELLYPERMRFRFRVEGVDADWVDAGSQRDVVWAPPGPGTHRFLVEARNEDGVWSAAPAVVFLDVLPAWWQTTTVRAAAALGMVLLGAGVFRWRIRHIERRHADRLRVLEEQRQAEERVASLRAQLEQVARTALAGELAASLAHEVRQPIGAIVNNAEAGKRHLAHYLQRPDDLEAIFSDIVADGMRASEVVRGLRGFLHTPGPDATAIDLSAVVREMLPLLRRELEDNHVEVDLALAEGLPPVEGFRVQLGQVVMNLVMNACEALADIDGDRRIAISTVERDGRVALVVRDCGPGLAVSVAARVFEPFVTTKPEGLGMGLAICRSIAETHGGHLSADTPPEGGLRMTLSLPATSALAPQP